MKKWLALFAAMLLFLPAASVAEETDITISDETIVEDVSPDYSLPVDSTPGKKPIESCYTENGYEDDSITVEMYQEWVGTSRYNVAHVTIKDASQLRTATSGKKTRLTSAMAAENNAVVAVSGDYYSDRSGGYIVRQGKTIRSKMKKGGQNTDSLMIDQYGDFHILVRTNPDEVQELLESGLQAVNVFYFGPGLIKDGEMLTLNNDYPLGRFITNDTDQRAAIGQIGPLEYMIVTVNGRDEYNSRGATVAAVAQYMYLHGCIQAYELDGGNTANLIFHNESYSGKTKNERAISDIIYFATSVAAEGN